MTDDESKRIILSRRARFVAAALASAGLAAAPACGGDTDEGKGGAGGSGGQTRDARVDEPQVCLSIAAGTGGTGGTGGVLFDAAAEPASDATDADAEPQPCLSPVP